MSEDARIAAVGGVLRDTGAVSPNYDTDTLATLIVAAIDTPGVLVSPAEADGATFTDGQAGALGDLVNATVGARLGELGVAIHGHITDATADLRADIERARESVVVSIDTKAGEINAHTTEVSAGLGEALVKIEAEIDDAAGGNDDGN